jgi:hypothetical protein
MKHALLSMAFFALTGGASLSVAQQLEAQGPLTLEEAVDVAERFVRDNGYTDAPADELKVDLDFESVEFTANREELLLQRKNSLQPKAIGARPTSEGWGVAFDYFKPQTDTCRVVVMRHDGSAIRVQHQDGIREFWLGLGASAAAE